MSFVSYAQNFEDVMLWRALGHIESGRYVDVGAQHPEVDSVSKALYDRGWRGVHVEPVPEYARLLRRERPDEIVLEAVVAESTGQRTLNVVANSGLSTLSDEVARRHEAEQGFRSHRMPVRSMTLDQVFAAANFSEIHWLKVDVEGSEAEAMAGWDAATYRPWLVLIEATIPLSQVDASHRWRPLLAVRGYEQVYFDGLNCWFVRKESRELAAAFSAPPNFFDDFVPAREFRLQQRLETTNRELADARRRLAEGSKSVAPPATSIAEREATGVPTAALKLRAQEFGRIGRMDEAEAILCRVLDAAPDDAEALGMLAIIDSERGRHRLAIERGLRAAQLTSWRSDVLCQNLSTFIRRVSHYWERSRLLRKGLPLSARRRATEGAPKAPRDDYDVVVLQRDPSNEPSRFEDVFAVQRTGAGRIVRLSQAGRLRETVREALEWAGSGLLVFVDQDDIPLGTFCGFVDRLQQSDCGQWGFARATALDSLGESAETAYGRYRQQLARLSEMPCLDFALFERSDVTGGVLGIRRAAVEQIVDRLPDLPFSYRALAMHAALEFAAVMFDDEIVARPASAFDRAEVDAAPLLPAAYERLMANAAPNTNAPMPREWGVLAWSLAVDQSAGADLRVEHWTALLDEVASLEGQFTSADRRHRGVNLVGMPLGMFGLAESMRAFVRAADVVGLPTCIGDLGVNFKPEQSDPRLLDRIRDRLPFRASIVFANPDILHDCWPAQLREHDRYRIGYWYWEADRLPKEWSYAFDLVEEIWVATGFVKEAVERSTTKPVIVMPAPIELETPPRLSKSFFGLDEGVFWFLISFDFNSFIERKNPYAAIEAFRRAFQDSDRSVGLLIKTLNGETRPAKFAALHALIDDDPRIVLQDRALPRDHVLALLNVADCYVSLHRAEGLGLGLAESMYLGKPVIGTAYSGNVDFMDAENSCLVRCSLVPVTPGDYPHSKTNDFRWAEADIEHAAYFMRRIVTDPHYRAAIAKRASSDIRTRFDPRVIGQAMYARLREVGVT